MSSTEVLLIYLPRCQVYAVNTIILVGGKQMLQIYIFFLPSKKVKMHEQLRSTSYLSAEKAGKEARDKKKPPPFVK